MRRPNPCDGGVGGEHWYYILTILAFILRFFCNFRISTTTRPNSSAHRETSPSECPRTPQSDQRSSQCERSTPTSVPTAKSGTGCAGPTPYTVKLRRLETFSPSIQSPDASRSSGSLTGKISLGKLNSEDILSHHMSRYSL